MKKKEYLTTKEVAEFLDINEKMVYQLINEKGLPACRVTGKWLFPRNLLEKWLESHTINRPKPAQSLLSSVIIIIGSHDLLLEAIINEYNKNFPEIPPIVYSPMGSSSGLKALKKGICHIASSHLMHESEEEYNFAYIEKYLEDNMPAVINFCLREQGIIVQQGNPKRIKDITSFTRKDITIANRPKGTGTRLLLDHELKKRDIDPSSIKGYENEFPSHLSVAIEVLSKRADAAIGIKAVATMLGLDFIPLRWERYDLFIPKEFFFEKEIQRFLGMIQDNKFKEIASKFDGYKIDYSGRIIFPKE